MSTAAPADDPGNPPAADAPRRVLLKERAYAALREAILDGSFPPGSFLSERQLSARLGMSKTPIRGAIERLEHEGFVAVAPQQGIVVREPSVQEIVDQFEIRVALEGYAIRHVSGTLTPDQVRRLEANLADQRAAIAPRQIRRCVELDTDFHLLFCEFLGNREILRVMWNLRDKVHRVIARVYAQDDTRFRTSYEEHRAIADAAIAGDPALAARRIQDHLDFGLRHLVTPPRAGHPPAGPP